MSDDPVTNKLAMDLIYADETLQQEVEERIKDIARAKVAEILNNPETFKRFMVNNAYELDRQTMRAFKAFINNPQNIY